MGSPTPIGLLAKSHNHDSSTAAPTVPRAMTIMQRPGFVKEAQTSRAGTTESSVVPSKSGSEVGDESQQGTGAVSPTDSTLAKDKAALTRAEREARYKEKREELFGPETEGADSNEGVNEASRTSSRNEEKKRKKKHKVNNNDDFEARSKFTSYYPTMQYAVGPYDQSTTSSQYYAPLIVPGNSHQGGQSNFCGANMMQQGFQQPFQSSVPGQAGPTMMVQNNMTNGYGMAAHFQGYEHQTPTQYYTVMQPTMQMPQQPSAISSPAMDKSLHTYPSQAHAHDQASSHQMYSNWYAQQTQQQQHFIPPSLPYQFGQLPVQPNTQNGKLAHPLPGSYTRPQTFNPQTRSFVPNGAPANPALPSSQLNNAGVPEPEVLR